MADPTSFQFDLPRNHDLPLISLKTGPFQKRVHETAWACAPNCASLRGGAARDAVSAIVMHATAGSSSAGAVSVMQAGRASFHWIIPGKDEEAHGRHVWATCPERLAAWHVRKSCAHPQICAGAVNLNRVSLGIEIVNRQDGADPFSDWQIKASAKIIRYAAGKYPNLVHVVSHARLDPDRRSDPGANFPWAKLKAMVLD